MLFLWRREWGKIDLDSAIHLRTILKKCSWCSLFGRNIFILNLPFERNGFGKFPELVYYAEIIFFTIVLLGSILMPVFIELLEAFLISVSQYLKYPA
jgi:hypothetical protein